MVENKVDLAQFSVFELLGSQLPACAPRPSPAKASPNLRVEILRHIGGEIWRSRPKPDSSPTFATKTLVGRIAGRARRGHERRRQRIPHEMLLLDLYNALRPLDEITGATTTDDILNLIFSTFLHRKVDQQQRNSPGQLAQALRETSLRTDAHSCVVPSCASGHGLFRRRPLVAQVHQGRQHIFFNGGHGGRSGYFSRSGCRQLVAQLEHHALGGLLADSGNAGRAGPHRCREWRRPCRPPPCRSES